MNVINRPEYPTEKRKVIGPRGLSVSDRRDFHEDVNEYLEHVRSILSLLDQPYPVQAVIGAMNGCAAQFNDIINTFSANHAYEHEVDYEVREKDPHKTGPAPNPLSRRSRTRSSRIAPDLPNKTGRKKGYRMGLERIEKKRDMGQLTLNDIKTSAKRLNTTNEDILAQLGLPANTFFNTKEMPIEFKDELGQFAGVPENWVTQEESAKILEERREQLKQRRASKTGLTAAKKSV